MNLLRIWKRNNFELRNNSNGRLKYAQLLLTKKKTNLFDSLKSIDHWSSYLIFVKHSMTNNNNHKLSSPFHAWIIHICIWCLAQVFNFQYAMPVIYKNLELIAPRGYLFSFFFAFHFFFSPLLQFTQWLLLNWFSRGYCLCISTVHIYTFNKITLDLTQYSSAHAHLHNNIDRLHLPRRWKDNKKKSLIQILEEQNYKRKMPTI